MKPKLGMLAAPSIFYLSLVLPEKRAIGEPLPIRCSLKLPTRRQIAEMTANPVLLGEAFHSPGILQVCVRKRKMHRLPPLSLLSWYAVQKLDKVGA